MKIVEINDYNSFLSLEQRWNLILKRCDHTVFSTWEWLSTWWKHFGHDKKLLLLVAEEKGITYGIAPLMYSVYDLFGLRRGKIEFIGSQRPRSDYTDFIIADKEDECIRSFIKHLNGISERWDCIDLTNIPENSKILPSIKKITNTLKPLTKCPYTKLPSSHQTYIDSLKHKQKKNLRRNLLKIERNFKTDFVDLSDSPSINEQMKIFFDLHQKRWTAKGFSGAFADRKVANFHLDIARRFSKKGWLGLFMLRLSDVPAAALYGFRYNSKFYYYLSGFDPKFFEYSVGSLLTSFAIERSIKEGFVEFDFTRGGEEYKNHWNTMTRWNYRAVLTQPGVIPSIKHRIYEGFWQYGTSLQHILHI